MCIQNGEWQEGPAMLEAKGSMASVELTPDLWWITGGQASGTFEFNSTEVYSYSSGTFTSYVNLPRGASFHNLFAVNDTHFVFLGGNWNGSNVSNIIRFN